MRVLVLSHTFPNVLKPNAGTFVLEQICALRSLGIEITPIGPTPWPPPPLKFLPHVRQYSAIPARSNARLFSVEHPRFLVLPRSWLFSGLGISYYLGCRRLIAQLVREKRIGLIHAHTIMPDGFAAVLLGRELNLPVVCTIHGSDINLYPHRSLASLWATRWALNRVSRVIAVSDHLKANIFRLVGQRQVEVVRNGADAEVFVHVPKHQARTKLGLPLNQKIVLFVGRLTEVKQIPILLEAMRLLSQPEVHLYLVGDGELKSKLIATAEQLGIAAQCSFVGAHPHAKIPVWFSAADCLVLCSRMEGLPTVLPEAMMSQVPIIATEVGGIPELIKHRDTGLLVPSGDAVALGQAIDLLLTDKGLSASMAMRAAATAGAEYTWHANAEKTAAIYQHALDDWRLAGKTQTDPVHSCVRAAR